MRIGLSAYGVPAGEVVALAAAADEHGFDSLWLGEHVLLPVGYASEHPGAASPQHHRGPIVEDSTVLVDPLVTLAAATQRTERLLLATGIYLVGLRHPLAVARMTMTLQQLAGGRFVLGVGSGWLREEFDALDVAFDERGRRLDRAIEVLRQAWSGEPFDHDGVVVRMAPERVDIPLVLGGNSDIALRRAVRSADGWFSSGTPPFEEAVRLRGRIGELSDDAGRPSPLRCWFRVAAVEELARYEDAGFDDVVLWADQLWPGDASRPFSRPSSTRSSCG